MSLYRFSGRLGRRSRFGLGSLAAVCILLLSAACSSSGSSSTTGSTTGSAASNSNASTGTSTSTSSCLNQANATASQAAAPLPLPPSTGTVPGSKVAGKTIWWVGLDDSNAIAAPELAGLQAAAAMLKVRVVAFDGKGSIATAIQGISTAVAAKPAGIVLWAINNDEANTALEQAKASHIPVVSLYEAGALTAGVIPANVGSGKDRAVAALVATKCQMRAITFTGIGLTSAQEQTNAFVQETHSLCNQCVIHAATYDATDPAGVLPELTSNELSRYPNTNIILTSSDAENQYYLSAIQSRGATSVKLVGQPGLPNGIQAIENGQEIGDVASPSTTFIGWQAMDQLLHVMLNGAPDEYDSTIAIKLITPDGLAKLSNKSDLFPELDTYQSAFEKRWDIGA